MKTVNIVRCLSSRKFCWYNCQSETVLRLHEEYVSLNDYFLCCAETFRFMGRHEFRNTNHFNGLTFCAVVIPTLQQQGQS
jgi:hypothetical protein